MVFRKTQNEYSASPVGTVSDYKNGTFIDSDNNVYEFDGIDYIKIGYDIPQYDSLVAVFPKIGMGVVFVNLFFPKRPYRSNNGLVDLAGTLLGLLLVATVILWLRIFNWIFYNLYTLLLAKLLLKETEKIPKLRLFLPHTWFIDDNDPDRQRIAMSASTFPLYLITFVIGIPFLETDSPIGVLVPLSFIFGSIAGFHLWLNVKINRDYHIDKF